MKKVDIDKFNCEIPILKKGEVRVMWDDGEKDGSASMVMDFAPGEVNDALRNLVKKFLDDKEIG